MTDAVAMKPFTYTSEQDADYVKALTAVRCLDDLRAVTTAYAAICADAKAITDVMTEDDFVEYVAGTKKERRGQFAGEDFARKFGAIHIPETMMRISLIAQDYKVPFGLVYLRLREQGHV